MNKSGLLAGAAGLVLAGAALMSRGSSASRKSTSATSFGVASYGHVTNGGVLGWLGHGVGEFIGIPEAWASYTPGAITAPSPLTAGNCLQATGTLTATTTGGACGGGGGGGIGTITATPPLGISMTGATLANISIIAADFANGVTLNGSIIQATVMAPLSISGGAIGLSIGSGLAVIGNSLIGTVGAANANNNLTVTSGTVGAGPHVVINTITNTFTSAQSITGALQIGAPTGGMPSSGTVNAQGVLINNVAAMTNFRTNTNAVIGTVTNGGTITQFVAVAGSGVTIDGTAGSGTYGPGIHTFSAAAGGGGGIGSIVSGNLKSATITNSNTITVPQGTIGTVFGFLTDNLTFSGNNSIGGTILHSGIETFSGTIILGGKIDLSYQAFNTTLTTIGASLCGHMLDYTNSVTGTLVWPAGQTDCNVGEAYFGTGSLVNTFLASTTVVGAGGTIGPSTIYAGISVHEFDNTNNQYVIFGNAK